MDTEISRSDNEKRIWTQTTYKDGKFLKYGMWLKRRRLRTGKKKNQEQVTLGN